MDAIPIVYQIYFIAVKRIYKLIYYRLQNVYVLKFFRKFFEHRHVLDVNKAEEQPKITPNSVYLYKDPSNYIIQRRSAERYLVFMLLTQAWTAPAALMYIYLSFYFNVLVNSKNI